MAGAQSSKRFILNPQGRLPEATELFDTLVQCFDFIRCSTTCIGYDTDASAPSPPAQTFPELRPVFLPNEITLRIFQYLDEPYKLQGHLTFVRKADCYPIIIFYKPRLWASMSTFQICRATRSQAIRRYGQPSQYSLPFDGTIDSLSLQQDVFERQHVSMFDIYTLETHYPNYFPLPRRFRNFTISGSFFYCHVDKPSATALTPVKQLGSDLQSRILSMEIEVEDDRIFSRGDQKRVAPFFSEKFTALHTLKLKLNRHDTCGIDRIEGYMYLKKYDYNTICHLVIDIPFFTSLSVFEIEKTKARCRARTKEDKCMGLIRQNLVAELERRKTSI
ncbi:hypothetical protein FHL15_010671 [Xylaria flabelliformis]|uniref:F-box domain-containing protein n=1 Tax=Xylaria flabelliformis TaxID=2512241 RepID=A0A553HKD8_9PEZI|nr:hypothetical protein FHL15_010671 [Xylaria flabelliformis]